MVPGPRFAEIHAGDEQLDRLRENAARESPAPLCAHTGARPAASGPDEYGAPRRFTTRCGRTPCVLAPCSTEKGAWPCPTPASVFRPKPVTGLPRRRSPRAGPCRDARTGPDCCSRGRTRDHPADARTRHVARTPPDRPEGAIVGTVDSHKWRGRPTQVLDLTPWRGAGASHPSGLSARVPPRRPFRRWSAASIPSRG